MPRKHCSFLLLKVEAVKSIRHISLFPRNVHKTLQKQKHAFYSELLRYYTKLSTKKHLLMATNGLNKISILLYNYSEKCNYSTYAQQCFCDGTGVLIGKLALKGS